MFIRDKVFVFRLSRKTAEVIGLYTAYKVRSFSSSNTAVLTFGA